MVADLRTPEEHDCDRILYSAAFRRLAGVTQVVAVDEIQLFHNRLTHTIKVAQLARRLSQDLVRDPNSQSILEAIGGVNEAAAEAAALAHDLGHPPFGHIGEEVLCRCCDAAGADGFEGNAQSFRIVTKLARRASDEAGLDLHPCTLRGILKYPWLRGPKPGEGASKEAIRHYRKWGAYRSEEEEFSAVVGPDEERSAEAQIMDWCDDISYALHDLEDFFRANLIPLEKLGNFSDAGEEEALEFFGRANRELATDPDFRPDAGAKALKRVRGFFPGTPYRGTHEDRRSLHTMTSRLMSSYLESVRVRKTPSFIRVTVPARHEVAILKQLTWQYVVNGPSLATVQEGEMLVIEEVFDCLTTWLAKEKLADKDHRLPGRLINMDRALHEDPAAMDTLDTPEARHARTVADYLCSLTEDQVLDLHRRLSGRASRSILEGWVRW